MSARIAVGLTLAEARWLIQRVSVLPAPTPEDTRRREAVYVALAHALGAAAERSAAVPT